MDNSDILRAIRPHMQDWFERPEHLDLIIAPEGDYSQPHGQVRFLDEIDEFHNWHWLELRHLHHQVRSEDVQAFADTFPDQRPPVHRLMLSMEGYTQAATVLAQQHGIQCITVAHDERTRDHGYLRPEISVQTIHSPRQLSQRDWTAIHDRLNDSLKDDAVEAVLASTTGEPSYQWQHLRNALPVEAPFDQTQDYRYDLPGYQLQVTDFDALPIEGVTFRYATSFKALEGEDEAEALADLLREVLLVRV